MMWAANQPYWPFSSSVADSAAKVENVVSPPRKPVAISRRSSGDRVG